MSNDEHIECEASPIECEASPTNSKDTELTQLTPTNDNNLVYGDPTISMEVLARRKRLANYKRMGLSVEYCKLCHEPTANLGKVCVKCLNWARDNNLSIK